MTAYSVGQTLLWIAPYGHDEPREVTVTKVGRTRVTVVGALSKQEAQFRMEGGRGVQEFTGRVVTPEAYAAEQVRSEAQRRLRAEFGLMFTGAHVRDLPVSVWPKLLELLTAARAEAQS